MYPATLFCRKREVRLRKPGNRWQSILELARDMGMEVEERQVDVQEPRRRSAILAEKGDFHA